MIYFTEISFQDEINSILDDIICDISEVFAEECYKKGYNCAQTIYTRIITFNMQKDYNVNYSYLVYLLHKMDMINKGIYNAIMCKNGRFDLME